MLLILLAFFSLGGCLSCQAADWSAEQRAAFQEQLTAEIAVATVALMVDIPTSRLRELQNIRHEDIKNVTKVTTAPKGEEIFQATLSNGDCLVAHIFRD